MKRLDSCHSVSREEQDKCTQIFVVGFYVLFLLAFHLVSWVFASKPLPWSLCLMIVAILDHARSHAHSCEIFQELHEILHNPRCSGKLGKLPGKKGT